MTVFRPFALVALVLLMTACTYREENRSNPILRNLAWFSYLNGDDIRSYCRAGGPDRYRLVYNGNWYEQVRTYDLTATGDGGADLVIQVSGDANLMGGISLSDPLAPWRGRIERGQVGRGEFRAIRDALHASGFATPPPKGTRLKSWGFFWLAAGCEGGKFRYNGWAHPSARFEGVRLRDALMAVDKTGVAFNPPREVDFRLDREQKEAQQHYQLVITAEGIKDNFIPF
jgi:hypothetical protein